MQSAPAVVHCPINKEIMGELPKGRASAQEGARVMRALHAFKGIHNSRNSEDLL